MTKCSTSKRTLPDTASSAITVFSRTEAAYGSRRNPEREWVSAGGTAYTMVQRSFQDSGLLECQARRMNPAAFVAAGYSADAMAHASIKGKTVNINLGHADFTNGILLRWTMGHEPMHNTGLRDQRLNGIIAYRHGNAAQQSAFQNLPGTDPARARVNPDNLLDFAQ